MWVWGFIRLTCLFLFPSAPCAKQTAWSALSSCLKHWGGRSGPISVEQCGACMQQRHMRPVLAQHGMPKHSSACPGCGDVPRASLVIPDLAYLETLDSLVLYDMCPPSGLHC